MKDEKGFTLIEAIVVIAVLAILAGTLVPLAIKNIEDSKLSAATEDVRTLSSALTNFIANTGEYPTRNNTGAKNTLYALYSGNPANFPNDSTPGGYWTQDRVYDEPLRDHLIQNGGDRYPAWDSNSRIGWHGPYIAKDGLDPWGNNYFVGVIGFWYNDTNPGSDYKEVWVLSAGPDADIQTAREDSEIPSGSDDIGVIIYIHD